MSFSGILEKVGNPEPSSLDPSSSLSSSSSSSSSYKFNEIFTIICK